MFVDLRFCLMLCKDKTISTTIHRTHPPCVCALPVSRVRVFRCPLNVQTHQTAQRGQSQRRVSLHTLQRDVQVRVAEEPLRVFDVLRDALWCV